MDKLKFISFFLVVLLTMAACTKIEPIQTVDSTQQLRLKKDALGHEENCIDPKPESADAADNDVVDPDEDEDYDTEGVVDPDEDEDHDTEGVVDPDEDEDHDTENMVKGEIVDVNLPNLIDPGNITSVGDTDNDNPPATNEESESEDPTGKK